MRLVYRRRLGRRALLTVANGRPRVSARAGRTTIAASSRGLNVGLRIARGLTAWLR